MKPKRGLLIALALIVIVGVTGAFVFMIQTNGKEPDEDTNRTEEMIPIDRGNEEPIQDDGIKKDGLQITYDLPDGLYFEYEDEEITGGCMKEYMDRNFKKMVDVYLYEVHNEDVGIIDTENPDNSVVYKDITIDGAEWFREMRLAYLERDDANDIQTEKMGDYTVDYFVKYFENSDGIMQGTLAGVITIDESHYYCVKIVEFDQDSAPDMDDYRKLFLLHVQSGQS